MILKTNEQNKRSTPRCNHKRCEYELFTRYQYHQERQGIVNLNSETKSIH